MSIIQSTPCSADHHLTRLHTRLGRFSLLAYSLLIATIACFSPIILIVFVVTLVRIINPVPDPATHPTTFVYPGIEETIEMIRFSVLFAPLLETLLCQLIAIEFLKKLVSSPSILILVTAIIFGLGHLGRSGQSAVMATFVGIFLSFTYIHWLQKSGSKLRAFIAVALTHAFHNAYYVLFTFIPASVLF